MYSQKYKEFYTTNYGQEKGSCKTAVTFKKINNKYESIYKNILDFAKTYQEYKQISSGLNHYRRDIVIVDIDENIHEPTIIANSFPIKPNAYSYNKKNGHCQYQWFLNEPMRPNEEWNKLRKLMNKNCINFTGFKGDINWTGWQIRNPYYFCDQYENKIYSENLVSSTELYQKFYIRRVKKNQSIVKITKQLNKKIKQKQSNTSSSSICIDVAQLNNESRNYRVFLEACNLAFEYDNKQDFIKSLEPIVNEVRSFKSDHEYTDIELQATINSVWTRKLNKTLYRPSGWTDEDRKKAATKKINERDAKLASFVYTAEYCNYDMSKVQEILDVSTRTIRNWTKLCPAVLKHIKRGRKLNSK